MKEIEIKNKKGESETVFFNEKSFEEENLGICKVKLCVRCEQVKATVDYNGHGHWVCDHCNRMLENEFEDEYR